MRLDARSQVDLGALSASAPAPPQRDVYVGLDFGTSTTKVIVQVDPDRQEAPRFAAIRHIDAIPGFSPWLFPSTAVITHDQILYGFEAEEITGYEPIRSFKMCLRCQFGGGGAHCPRCGSHGDGRFIRGGREWTAEEISALFLGHTLARVQEAVGRAMPRAEIRYFINSAAPLDQVAHESELGRAFERVLHMANELSEFGPNLSRTLDAVQAIEEVRRRAMLERERRRTSVFPETHAAMTSLLHEGLARDNYGVIDIGAGTTDVAFFYYHAVQGWPEACYYRHGSKFIGMDQVDLAVGIDAPPGTANLRRWRETLSAMQLHARANEIGEVMDKLQRYTESHWRTSYGDNPGPQYWADRNVFLLGGGATFEPARKALQRPMGYIVGPTRFRLCTPTIDDGVGGLALDGSLVAGPANEGRMLLLAFGLAHGAANIARWVRDYSFVRPERDAALIPAEVRYDE